MIATRFKGWLPYLLIGIFALGLSIWAYILYSMRQLPWQSPVFDTEIPKSISPVNANAVLIFSKTNGFRHQSIEAGISAIKIAGKKNGWDVHATENGAMINPGYLRQFKVVIFLSNTGEILTHSQKSVFENYIENGGGYAGIHSASDTEHGWAWYGKLLGTFFRDHTLLPYHLPEAEIITENLAHPINRGLPARWNKVDEWYNFRESVRRKEGFQVLLGLNEDSYPSFWHKMNGDHPISWTHRMKKGRMFYTAMGHNAETFTDQIAMQHIIGGIAWAGKLE
jgi:hypothetical protein